MSGKGQGMLWLHRSRTGMPINQVIQPMIWVTENEMNLPLLVNFEIVLHVITILHYYFDLFRLISTYFDTWWVVMCRKVILLQMARHRGWRKFRVYSNDSNAVLYRTQRITFFALHRGVCHLPVQMDKTLKLRDYFISRYIELYEVCHPPVWWTKH